MLELGNITILAFIMISKCHDNRYRREIFSRNIGQHNIIVNTVIIVRIIAQKHSDFITSVNILSYVHSFSAYRLYVVQSLLAKMIS